MSIKIKGDNMLEGNKDENEHENVIFKKRFDKKYFLAFIYTILIEASLGKMEHINAIIKSKDISQIIYLIYFYIAAFIIILIYRKLFSTSDIIFNIDIINKINDIIRYADKNIIIVSPYFNIGNNLMEDLICKAKEGISIVIIHNSTENTKSEFQKQYLRLSQNGVKFYNHPRLHAKIYLNDRDIVITSLNLLTSSIENSLESGVHINYGSKYREVLGYIDFIKKSDLTKETIIENITENGYCIKTRKEILFNRRKPIEYNTYFSNRNDNGKYCHYCGKEYATTIENPFCDEHQSML